MIRVLAAILLASSLQPVPDALPEEVRWVMGTHLRVVLAAPDLEPDVARSILRAVFQSVERDEALISNYRPDSHLSRVNSRAGGGWVDVPREVCAYLERSWLDSHATRGAFDLTAGAAMRDSTLRAGIAALEFRCDTPRPRVRLTATDVALDPGGNGKGWALDRAVRVLRGHGIRHALLDFGGSSWYGMGVPPEGEAWRVTVQDTEGRPAGVVRLRDQALSVSEAWRPTPDGRSEETHILDPSTRRPVQDQRMAVVVSPSATDAEVLSTALVVAGMEGLWWLGNYPGSDAVLIEPEGIRPAGGRPWWFPKR